MRLCCFVALCLLLLAPEAARADDIGPAQAQALQQQLKDWLGGLLGPSVKLPDLPWQVTGEHDHYVITWPIPGLTSPAGEAVTTTNVRPLDGGRWSIDAMKLPPSGNFTVTIPQNGDAATAYAGEDRFQHRQAGHARRDRSWPCHRIDAAYRDSATSCSPQTTRTSDRSSASIAISRTPRWRRRRTGGSTSPRCGDERLEIRVADQRRHAGGDRHPDDARGRPGSRA